MNIFKYVNVLLLLSCFVGMEIRAFDEELIPGGSASSRPALKDPKEIVGLQLTALDLLSRRTELTLQQIAHLRQKVAEYEMIQENYLQNVEDRQLLSLMLNAAENLLGEIREVNMVAIFDLEFISELTTLSQLNKKLGLPKPSVPQL